MPTPFPLFQYARDVTDGSDSVHKGDPANFVSFGFVYDSSEQSFENGFFGQNPQCEYLGAEPTFAAVIEATRLAGLNIGSVDDVDRAISAFLGKHNSIRMNVSRNASVQWDLPPGLIARFKAAHSEDEKLYQAFGRRRSSMASEHQIKPVASRAADAIAAASKRPSVFRARWKPQWLS